MEPSSQDQLLRLKIASEIVLGNQASVAFSRAFYLEDVLIDRIHKECLEVSQSCLDALELVEKFTQEVENNDASSNLTPLTESSVRCQCSEMFKSLTTDHQPTLNGFKQKLTQAKACRQAKSCLLETLSTQNNNITSQFNTMTLNELINDVHIPEFSCFINESDFGELEKLIEEWDEYREKAKQEFVSVGVKLDEFRKDMNKTARMREYTCDMILAQITQQKHPQSLSGDTLKKKGVFHKFSTLLRRRHTHQPDLRHEQSPTPSQFSLTAVDNQQHQQSF